MSLPVSVIRAPVNPAITESTRQTFMPRDHHDGYRVTATSSWRHDAPLLSPHRAQRRSGAHTTPAHGVLAVMDHAVTTAPVEAGFLWLVQVFVDHSVARINTLPQHRASGCSRTRTIAALPEISYTAHVDRYVSVGYRQCLAAGEADAGRSIYPLPLIVVLRLICAQRVPPLKPAGRDNIRHIEQAIGADPSVRP